MAVSIGTQPFAGRASEMGRFCIICEEELFGRQKKYCCEACREKGKKRYSRKWYEKNKEQVKAYNKQANQLPEGEYKVYRITCPDGRIYIGSSNTKPEQRLRCHANKNRKSKSKLTHACIENDWTAADLKLDILCHRSNKTQARAVENAFIKTLRQQYPDKVLNKNLNRLEEANIER